VSINISLKKARDKRPDIDLFPNDVIYTSVLVLGDLCKQEKTYYNKTLIILFVDYDDQEEEEEENLIRQYLRHLRKQNQLNKKQYSST
jgi:hypothetical protein